VHFKLGPPAWTNTTTHKKTAPNRSHSPQLSVLASAAHSPKQTTRTPTRPHARRLLIKQQHTHIRQLFNHNPRHTSACRNTLARALAKIRWHERLPKYASTSACRNTLARVLADVRWHERLPTGNTWCSESQGGLLDLCSNPQPAAVRPGALWSRSIYFCWQENAPNQVVLGCASGRFRSLVKLPKILRHASKGAC
jgi:hypothetical protein